MTLNTSAKKIISTLGSILVCISLFSGCAKENYLAKPIESTQITHKLNNKDPTSAEFKTYLIKHGYTENNLPLANWGLNDLTLCALYYHNKLDVAKAQLALAKANIDTAGLRQNPTWSGNLSRSDQANEDIRPWLYGLTFEIPIETSNKRSIRIEEAQHLAEVAQIDIAETAWQLRSQIALDLLRYHENMSRTKLLSQELQVQDNLILMLEKRVQVGALSNAELHSAKLLQQKVRFALTAEQAKTQEIRASLATGVGLTSERFETIKLKTLDLDATLTEQGKKLATLTSKELQENALVNRLDIRRSLEKYAAAEAKIKLEVAKQTPDISLSPGFAFEFGDSVWSLGFASLLNLLNKNQTLIQEAIKLRDVEGAQFEALQASIIGALDQNLASYQASAQSIQQVKQQQDAQLQIQQRMRRQFDAGLIDRLELTKYELNGELQKQRLSAAQFTHLQATLKLEEMMQRPIFDDFTLKTTTVESHSTEKGKTSP